MADAALTLVTEDSITKNHFISGTGVPNGTISAPIGSIYVDSAKTWDVISWIKVTGTGNTGWEVLKADPKVRSIIALNTSPITGGGIRYTRTPAGVTLMFNGVSPSTDGTLVLFGNQEIVSIAPPTGGTVEFRLGSGNSTVTRRAQFNQYGALTIYVVAASDVLLGSVSFATSRPWAAPLGTDVTS